MDLPSVEWWPTGAWGVFWLFMMPIGPAKPVGIWFGLNAELPAPMILAIYVAKEVATACYVEPLLRLIARLGPRSSRARSLGQQIRALAERTHLGSSWPAQFGSLALVSLATGLITSTAALACARVPRLLGWVAVILGDVIWFSFMLAATIGLASFLPDERAVLAAAVLLWLVARPLTKRLTASAPQPASAAD
jgi:hypothetical protein